MTTATPDRETLNPDPVEAAKLFSDIAGQSSRILAGYLQRSAAAQGSATDELGVAKAFMEMNAKLLADPFKLAQAHLNLWQDTMALWQHTALKMMGQQPDPVAVPAKGDKRFKHEAWEDSFLFDYIKQSYLIATRHLHSVIAGVEGLDQQTTKKVDFFTRQAIDALSPTNFALTNPEVFNETVRSGGKNLLKGLRNLLADVERGDGQLRVKMADPEAFRLGENIAVTPGKVVYQNELMQLIQYTPSSQQAHRRPLLVIPPWINKFYILDLRENNSFIKWSVDQGHTVFVISWVNPGAAHAQKTFDDYLLDGPLAALAAIEKATGEKEVNAVGYCLGGTLLACLLGYLVAKKEEQRIASATFLTSLIDFSEAGELGVFLDDATITSLEQRMQQRGYLEGHEMAGTFNMLRANDLIWSFVINNYLMGKEPLPFDLLHWNSDSTRMPAAMHSYYLRSMYQKNLLTKPGGIVLDGVPIDLSRVSTPAYFLSAADDHIAPWKSTYAGARLLAGPVKFVLAGSGHIAGVVNPPLANKYCHWVNPDLPASPDDWFAGTSRNEGSWWSNWNQWVAQFGGGAVAARTPGKGKLKAIEDAPGAYVKMRA